MESAPTQDESVDLVPLPVVVHELEIGPRPVGCGIWNEVFEELEALGFVGERRTGDLYPPSINRHVTHLVIAQPPIASKNPA
jgi:hypothetical protein